MELQSNIRDCLRECTELLIFFGVACASGLAMPAECRMVSTARERVRAASSAFSDEISFQVPSQSFESTKLDLRFKKPASIFDELQRYVRWQCCKVLVWPHLEAKLFGTDTQVQYNRFLVMMMPFDERVSGRRSDKQSYSTTLAAHFPMLALLLARHPYLCVCLCPAISCYM
eukprot:6214169-Pleurochrysis_carterae.AAC.2